MNEDKIVSELNDTIKLLTHLFEISGTNHSANIVSKILKLSDLIVEISSPITINVENKK
jgi:hypothetical protein